LVRASLGFDDTNFDLDSVGADGHLHLKVHHVWTGLDAFRQCYWDGLAAEIERRHAGGLTVPDWVNDHPDVSVEIADD
jgi:hypothetical protein